MDRVIRTDDGRRRFGEVRRHVGELELRSERFRAFFGVREIVAPDAEDVLLRMQRCVELDASKRHAGAEFADRSFAIGG